MFHLHLLGIALAVAVSSCQTATSKDESIEDPLDLEKQQALSSDLWSPEQRKANASYYFLLAEDRALAQDRETALKLYELAYNMDPNSFLASRLISSKAYLKPEEAFSQTKRMVLLYPKDPEINVLLGQFYLAKGRLQSALKQFNRVLDIDGSRIDAYIGLIQTYRSLGDPDKAAIACEKMLKVDPSFADGWAMLAKMYLGQKKTKKALKSAERAYSLRSNNPEFMHLYAITLELNGKSKRAVSLYETIFKMNPDNEELIARMVNLYKQIGSLEEALSLLKDVRSRSKKSNLVIDLQIIFIHWEMKHFEIAANSLEELLKEYPSNQRLIYMTALGAEKLSRWERAIGLYQQLDSDSQFSIHGQFRLILVYRQLKKYDLAKQVGLKVVDSKSERAPDFYILIANLEADRKDFSEAVEVLERATKEFPERTDIWFLLGINQEKNGDVDDCIETMKHLIKIDPKHAGAHNYLGYLYAERKENLDEAEALIRKALAIKPNDGYYLDSLGWVFFQKGDFQRAIKVLLDADKYAPNEGVILEHIGDAYKALDKMKEAYQYYEKATKGRLDERDKKRIFEKFEEMKKENE